MAISATCVWEIRTTGSDINGGGYTSGGTDYSQQNSAQLTLADVVGNGTTTLTSATGGFTSAMIGNIINVATVGRREITGYTNTNTITVDASVSAGTYTGYIGGALANPGECTAKGCVAGNKIWLKSGTYTQTSTSTSAGGACAVSLPAGSGSNFTWLEGYYSTRGDKPSSANKPVISAGALTSCTSVTINNATVASYVIVDSNNGASNQSFGLGNYALAYWCEAKNAKNSGFGCYGLNSITICCLASRCQTTQAYSDGLHLYSVAYNNQMTGFSGGSICCIGCISAYNTGSTGRHGFVFNQSGRAINCTAHQNGGAGFYKNASNTSGTFINCVATENGTYGFDCNSDLGNLLISCVGWSNSTADFRNTITSNQKINCSSASSDPFTASDGSAPTTSGYLSPNATASAGALLRSLAFPANFPILTGTTNYQDIGAIGHQDSASGGGGFLVGPSNLVS